MSIKKKERIKTDEHDLKKKKKRLDLSKFYRKQKRFGFEMLKY